MSVEDLKENFSDFVDLVTRGTTSASTGFPVYYDASPRYEYAGGRLAAGSFYGRGDHIGWIPNQTNVTVSTNSYLYGNLVALKGEGGGEVIGYSAKVQGDGPNVYGFISEVTNNGSGNSKALYGNAIQADGDGGVLVGVVASTQDKRVNSTDGPDHNIALQLSMDGFDNKVKGISAFIRPNPGNTDSSRSKVTVVNNFVMSDRDTLGYSEDLFRFNSNFFGENFVNLSVKGVPTLQISTRGEVKVDGRTSYTGGIVNIKQGLGFHVNTEGYPVYTVLPNPMTHTERGYRLVRKSRGVVNKSNRDMLVRCTISGGVIDVNESDPNSFLMVQMLVDGSRSQNGNSRRKLREDTVNHNCVVILQPGKILEVGFWGQNLNSTTLKCLNNDALFCTYEDLGDA